MQVLLHKPLSQFVAEHVVVGPPTSPVPTDVTPNVDAFTRARSAVAGLAADGGRNRLGGGGRRGQPALAETLDLPGIASWRTPQPVNTGRQSVRQVKTGVGAVKDEGLAAMTRPGAANVRTQVQDAEEVP